MALPGWKKVNSVEMINVLKLLGIANQNPSTEIKLGLIYNWYAATDASFIYADGWKIPTTTEFNTLRSNGSNYATGFKETGTTYWTAPNTWATNAFEFNGRGAGWRDSDGDFLNISERLIMLTTASSGDNTTAYFMQYDASAFNFASYPKKSGASIRLLKVSTSLSDGETGTYIGNDGKTYRTICIGNQEWLADNLAETKYRDGTPIPEVTGAAAWAALTTGGLCAYNNDWANAFITQSGNVRPKLMFIGAGIDNNLILSKSAISYEPEAISLFDNMVVEPSDALKIIINTAIRDLKLYGIWNKLDFLSVYAMHTEQAALLDWKGYSNQTNQNGMDFTQYTGFSYDTSLATVFINTNFDPSTDGVNFTLNDAMMGVWQEDRGDTAASPFMGARLSGNYNATMFRSGSNMTGIINGADTAQQILKPFSFGLTLMQRESNTTIRGIIDGSLGNNVTFASTMPVQRNLYVRGAQAFTVSGFSTNMFRASVAGASLTETEHQNFYSVMNAYMAAVDSL